MRVAIRELSFKTIIGILPFEREKTQKVIIDIEFEYLFDEKEKSFIDYSQVVTLVKKTMKKEKFELIEEALIFLKESLREKYPIENLQIKITKPTILKDCIVSVSLD